MNGLNQKEIKLLENILTKVYKMNSDFGTPTLPTGSILRHLYQRRLFNHFFPKCKNVLEIGPGAGYLSVLLHKDNINVYCTDVSQAYYIYQHYLFKKFDCLSEFFDFNKKTKVNNKIKHIPWFFFKNIPTKASIKLDCIIVNHAICEMHHQAVRHLLKFATISKVKNFFMEGEGSDTVSLKFDEVKRIFLHYGYYLKYCKNDVYIFEFDPDKRNKFKAIDIFKRSLKLIPFYDNISNEFFKYHRFLKRIVPDKNKSIFKKNKYLYKDILLVYEKVTGNKSFKSIDENFLQTIDR